MRVSEIRVKRTRVNQGLGVLQISFHTIVSSVMSSARSIGLFSDRLQMQPAVPLKFDWMILISHVNLELLPV